MTKVQARGQPGVLGLFPALDPAGAGGVQASGRVAWAGVSRLAGESGDGPSGIARLFCWPGPSALGRRIGPVSKMTAVIEAVRGRWSVELVLVWHLGLLKLLPFFRVRGARVALFLHGIEAWRRSDALTRARLRRVDLFLANSEHTWTRFVDVNPGLRLARHRVVHLGIDTPDESEPAPPGDPPAAVMLGRLNRDEGYKGHRELIGAWPLVLQRRPDARLWIVGDGDLREDLERQARRAGVADRVRFWGHVDEEEKGRLARRARCLLLPSRGEGFGLVYLEAMRLGRPCLVSTVDAGREVVAPPEAGLAADPASPAELAAATCRLLGPGAEWERWSEQARRRYEARFTAAHFQRRLVEALSLVEGGVPVGAAESRP